MMNKIIKYIISLIIVFLGLCPNNANAAEKEMVIAQMNSCVNTLTNIINNQSMAVLEHESDQLLNNLTMEQIVGLYEIAEFREDLIDAIGKLHITEEERNLLKRVNSIKRDNLKWQALSNALSNTMMITGGGNMGIQAGFQALVTAARTGVEYKVAQNELQIEELQAMWELRKDDLEEFINLRKNALKIIFSLYDKYNLKESDRLTEQTAQQFQKITSDPDASRMVRLLTDNYAKFGHLTDYYYYLGMGYIDIHNIPKAMDAFAKFEANYNKAPIYRINEKSGIISLTKVAYNNKLSPAEIEQELANALKNLPSNAMALIQCAIVYDRVLKNPKKALSVLRSALDNEAMSDKAAIIVAGSMILPKVPTQSPEYKDFIAAYSNQTITDIDAALNVCIARKYSIFNFLSKIMAISDLYNRPWYFGTPVLNDEMVITYPKKYFWDLSHVKMFVERRKGNEVMVTQYQLTDSKSIPLEKIEKVDAFKENPNLKYLYMWSSGENLFQVKENLDYKAIKSGDFPQQNKNFDLSDSDKDDIIKFLKKNENKSQNNEIIAKNIESKYKTLMKNGYKYLYPLTYENIILIKAIQTDATYVKFVFDSSQKIVVCYKFDTEKKKLIPCYTQYQGKIQFANKSFLKEFGYDKPKVGQKQGVKKEQSKKEKSWWEKLWSSDDEAPKKQNVKKGQPKKEKSWWEKLWGSDDEAPKKQDVKKEQPKKEKSWWEKLWGNEEEEKSKKEALK